MRASDLGEQMATWVELRVHGVSGTPPESMLGSAHVRQVAGDERSRVFRQTDAQGVEVHPSPDHLLEAFHWGRWTSGSWTQALWILLIPFGMVNAAQFMLPEPVGRGSGFLHVMCSAVLRLLALVLTGLFTVGAAVVTVDLVAWQWLGRREIPLPDRWLIGLALAVAALVVFLLSWIGQISRGAQYRFRHSPVTPATGDQALPGLATAAFFDGDPDNPTLRALHRAAALLLLGWLGLSVADVAGVGWAGAARVWALAVLALTVVVVFLLGDPEKTTTRTSGSTPRRLFRAFRRAWHGWLEPTAPRPEGAVARFRYSFRRLGLSWLTGWLLLTGSLAFLVLAAVGIGQATPSDGVGEVARYGLVGVQPALPAMDQTAAATGIAGTAAILLLLLAVAALSWATHDRNTPRVDGLPLPPFRRFAGGMTPALASAVGFFIGIGLTAGLALTVQGLLNRLRDDTADRVEPLVETAVRNLLDVLPPQFSGLVPAGDVHDVVARIWPDSLPAVAAPPVLQRVSYAWGLTLLLILALVVAALVWIGVRRATFRARAAAMMTFGADPSPRLPESWLRRVGTAMQVARLKKRGWLVTVFWVFAAAGLVFSLAATFGYAERSAWVGEHLPWLVSLAAFRWWPLLTGETTLPGEPISWPDVVIGAGQATLLGLAGGAVLLARGAIRAEGPRRALNVVWDVIAFWPRAVHPFVPPPYAQSVVPALVRRICWHLGEPDPLRGDGEPAVPADQPADRTDEQRAEVNPDFVRTVVVAAHSQGSLISLAALLWLPEPIRHRVRWLTFGSQLRQAFPRAFPHYVTVPILRHVLATHGWLNLYRDTDPIAGPVTSWGHTWGPGALTSCRLERPGQPLPDEIRPRTGRRECGREWRLLDPVPEDRALQRRPAAELQKHSNYWLDPDWDDALRAVGAPLGSVADEQRDRQPVQ